MPRHEPSKEEQSAIMGKGKNMDFGTLSLSELEALVTARKILDRARGADVPEDIPRATAKRAKATKRVAEGTDAPKDWSKVIKTCPRCGESGPVDPMFGTKPVRGIIYPQSWCSHCRATANYPRKARVYHSKHNPR